MDTAPVKHASHTCVSHTLADGFSSRTAIIVPNQADRMPRELQLVIDHENSNRLAKELKAQRVKNLKEAIDRDTQKISRMSEEAANFEKLVFHSNEKVEEEIVRANHQIAHITRKAAKREKRAADSNAKAKEHMLSLRRDHSRLKKKLACQQSRQAKKEEQVR